MHINEIQGCLLFKMTRKLYILQTLLRFLLELQIIIKLDKKERNRVCLRSARIGSASVGLSPPRLAVRHRRHTNSSGAAKSKASSKLSSHSSERSKAKVVAKLCSLWMGAPIFTICRVFRPLQPWFFGRVPTSGLSSGLERSSQPVGAPHQASVCEKLACSWVLSRWLARSHFDFTLTHLRCLPARQPNRTESRSAVSQRLIWPRLGSARRPTGPIVSKWWVFDLSSKPP